jgi:hypothetical protein
MIAKAKHPSRNHQLCNRPSGSSKRKPAVTSSQPASHTIPRTIPIPKPISRGVADVICSVHAMLTTRRGVSFPLPPSQQGRADIKDSCGCLAEDSPARKIMRWVMTFCEPIRTCLCTLMPEPRKKQKVGGTTDRQTCRWVG